MALFVKQSYQMRASSLIPYPRGILLNSSPLVICITLGPLEVGVIFVQAVVGEVSEAVLARLVAAFHGAEAYIRYMYIYRARTRTRMSRCRSARAHARGDSR